MTTQTANATGTFDVTIRPQPPHDEADGVSIGRAALEKKFHGGLDATSVGEMIGARTATQGSAGYIAMERVRGTLDGREGSFVLMHHGVMDRGAQSLLVTVVPDSGTGALAGLRGTLTIEIADGVHRYALAYTLPAT